MFSRKKKLKIIYFFRILQANEALSTIARIIYLYFNTILWNHEKTYNEN